MKTMVTTNFNTGPAVCGESGQRSTAHPKLTESNDEEGRQRPSPGRMIKREKIQLSQRILKEQQKTHSHKPIAPLSTFNISFNFNTYCQ
ncbi:hypothetical protein PCASD_20581 [Puccinia coronata f. sp. avenae]|uniref:Uncharacterized protein n=1 Tax=Puccinia coronata f. sp. avenae TaxID=200324 RepID=A0A2N5SP73_9BASI|nr:hypothetical protein PCASD_20581 [Puccinia coronata f. sp. avenae]